MAFCQNCGHELSNTASFCSGCGRPTESNQSRGNEVVPAAGRKRQVLKWGGIGCALLVAIAIIAVFIGASTAPPCEDPAEKSYLDTQVGLIAEVEAQITTLDDIVLEGFIQQANQELSQDGAFNDIYFNALIQEQNEEIRQSAEGLRNYPNVPDGMEDIDARIDRLANAIEEHLDNRDKAMTAATTGLSGISEEFSAAAFENQDDMAVLQSQVTNDIAEFCGFGPDSLQ